MSRKKLIVVSLQIPGLHHWPDAKGVVDYLAHLHRHVFHIVCKKEVTHNDRELEIIQFKEAIREDLTVRFYDKTFDICNFGRMSCEDICEMLINEFQLDYCSVLEDNENGAEIIIQ